MTIRKATIEDLPELKRVFDAARQIMRSYGNEIQWPETYPGRDLIVADIEAGHSYVLEDEEGIYGTFMFAEGKDPTYIVIEDGQWLNDEPYGVIHRIASDGRVGGVFPAALDFAKERTANVRIDTHEVNAIMRHVLKREGFVHCGTIFCHDGTPRMAFQYVRD